MHSKIQHCAKLITFYFLQVKLNIILFELSLELNPGTLGVGCVRGVGQVWGGWACLGGCGYGSM